MAEEQGFEPWVGYKPTPVFKTGALNHSATPPSLVRIDCAWQGGKRILRRSMTNLGEMRSGVTAGAAALIRLADMFHAS